MYEKSSVVKLPVKNNPSIENITYTNSKILPDDIVCDEWLKEIKFTHYNQVFLANFSHDGKILSRSRLAKVKLHHFPNMNITIHEDQKILIEHIKHTLNFPFDSQLRKEQVNAKYAKHEWVKIFLENSLKKKMDREELEEKSSILSRRRRSFDKDICKSLFFFKRKHKVENIYEKKPNRRCSVNDVIFDRNYLHIPCMEYKDVFPKYDKMLLEYEYQTHILEEFRKMISCERITILFHDSKSKKLLFKLGGIWHNIFIEETIQGACLANGSAVIISNPYNDNRFNKFIDIKTGVRTRNLLMACVGGPMGDAVIELSNSAKPIGFTEIDKQALRVFCTGLGSLKPLRELVTTCCFGVDVRDHSAQRTAINRSHNHK